MELTVMVLVIAALAVVAFVAIYSSLSSWNLETATSTTVTNIRYAQHLARTRNGWYGIRFQANPTNTYNVYSTDGVTDTNVPDPANPAQDLIIDVNNMFDGVEISAVNIAGGDKVEFDPTGTPYNDMTGVPIASDGSATLTLGSTNNVILIIKNTGRVELQ